MRLRKRGYQRKFTRMTSKNGKHTIFDYYVRHKRSLMAVGVLWGVLTCCFAVLNVVVFVTSNWMGRSEDNSGYIGLWRICKFKDKGLEMECEGHFNNFDSLPNSSFKAATFFIGVSSLFMFLCILLFFLFICLKAVAVYAICALLQFISAIFMFLGCIIFPSGWDHEKVQEVCGDSENFYIGECEIGWAYILAIIGIGDALFLAILAVFLASTQSRKPEVYSDTRQLQKDFYDAGMDEQSGKPPMYIQPSLTAPRPPDSSNGDRLSEYSHGTKRSKKSGFAL